MATGTPLHTLTTASSDAIAFSPDGKLLLAGSGSGPLSESADVQLWDVAAGKLLRSFGSSGTGARSVAFSPDGQQALAGSWDGTLKLWETSNGREFAIAEGRSDPTNELAQLAPDGRSAISACGSFFHCHPYAQIWDTATGRLAHALAHENQGGSLVRGAAFSADGKRLVTNGWVTQKVWDAGTGALLREIEAGADRLVFPAMEHGLRARLTSTHRKHARRTSR